MTTTLSSAQRRQWLLGQLGRPAAASCVAVALQMVGSVQPAALSRSLHDVLARHEVLSSVFVEHGLGDVRRHARRDGVIRVRVIDVDAISVTAATAALVEQPFNLTKEGPVRAALLRCARDQHVLVVVVHRIAADQASLTVLTDELLHAYTHRTRGEAPRWPRAPVQYAAHVARHDGRLTDPGTRADPTAFTGPPCPLPQDRSHPPVASLAAGSVTFWLEPALVSAAARLAVRNGHATSTIFQAALAVLLHQLGAGSDLPIGSLMDGRADPTHPGPVGPLETIELRRVDLSGNPSFTALLDGWDTKGARIGGDVPFEHLIEELRPEPTLAYHPLCQLMFSWRSAGSPVRELPSLTVTEEPVPTGTTPFDLAFSFVEAPGNRHSGISGEIRYAVDLFDRATAVALAERYERALCHVTTDPAVQVGAVDVLLPGERESAVTVSRTAAPLPATTVPELVRTRVVAAPDAVAVVCGERSLTYRQLWHRAWRLAGALTASGVAAGSLVGLACGRDTDLVVAMLGVLMTGAAYVPVDPRYPTHRLDRILADADPVSVLTDAASRPRLAGHPVRLHMIDELLTCGDAGDIDENGDADAAVREVPGPGSVVHPDDLAYVMYTSGSTGLPKGVGVSHATVVNGVTRLAEVLGVRPGSRMLASTSINFDVSVFEIVTALASGATVELVRDIFEITERRGWSGDVLHTVPSLFSEVLDDADVNIRVATAVFAGEALPEALVQQMCRLLPGTTVVNAYGQTESFYATTYTVPADWDAGAVPIGAPLSGMGTYVLNAALSPVPSGVVGDLYVSGMIARGYHGRSALTAACFVADPFGPPGSRMYRTGDLARHDPDGRLEIVGRSDTQMKIRGVRIEPAEIEEVLVAHRDVAQAVVALRPVPGRDGKRLVAYLVPARTGVELHPRRLRRFVADRLPAVMIPGAFVTLDRLPLTPNGKLDYPRLPVPATGRGARDRTARERRLAALFAEVLGRPAVEDDDDFFALGGDSFQVVDLLGRVRRALGVDVPVAAFFAAPTVAAIDDYMTSFSD